MSGRKTIAISTAAMVAALLATMAAIQWGGVTTDEAVTGSNLTWGVFAGVTGAFYTVRAWRRSTWDETRVLMIGIACVAWAGFLHRAYWTTFRYLRALDPQWWEVGAAWSNALVPVVWLTVFGYIWHLSPVHRRLFGRHWMAISLAIMLAWFWAGIWLTP